MDVRIGIKGAVVVNQKGKLEMEKRSSYGFSSIRTVKKWEGK
jgi:hypothetical protein